MLGRREQTGSEWSALFLSLPGSPRVLGGTGLVLWRLSVSARKETEAHPRARHGRQCAC